MKNLNTLNVSSTRTKSVLTLSFVAIASLLMFGLAMTASAATLTRELQFGMSGSDVSSLQAYLALDATIYPQGLVTGYYGSLTKSAVSNFQARHGIATVGRVGPITMALLNQLMNGDNSSPSFSGINVSPTNTSATISWNTNENSSAVIYYGTSQLTLTEGSPTSGVTVSGSSLLAHTDLRANHTAVLTSLQPNTTYHYVIYVRDGAGNESITWPAIFTTNQ